VPAGPGIASISFTPIIARRENAAEVLLKGDTRFFRYARGIGLHRLQEILDFLLNLSWDDMSMRNLWRDNVP
jgi:hypothetical protein